MRVNSSRNNIYNVKNQNPPSFKSGKTYLITDFDGTLKPDIKRNNTFFQGFKYFSAIRKFQDALSGKLKIIITTGRSQEGCNEIKDEMDYVNSHITDTMQKYLKINLMNSVNMTYNLKKNLYPYISSIITDNGEEKYKIVEDGIDYHLEYSQKYDKKKRNFLKQKYQIDLNEIGNSIKQKINQFPVLSQKIKYSQHFPSNFIINLDDSISSNLSDRLTDSLKKELIRKNVSFNISQNRFNNSKLVKFKRNGQKFSKDLYPLMKIEKAKQNNDLVIVAGNDVNDIEMLNIFSYVSLPKNVKIPSNYEEAQLLLTNHPEKIEEIAKLPLRIIVVGDLKQKLKEKHKSLMEFFEINFPEQYIFTPETITHDNHNYLKAIKSSILSYAKENPKFANEFSDKEINALLEE